MKKDYSIWKLLSQGLKNHEGWTPAWRNPVIKPSYDVVIIGAGGHGLATAVGEGDKLLCQADVLNDVALEFDAGILSIANNLKKLSAGDGHV